MNASAEESKMRDHHGGGIDQTNIAQAYPLSDTFTQLLSHLTSQQLDSSL